MFDHLNWANQRILETLQHSEVEGQQVRLFSHILNAERVWVTRLRGMDSSQLPIWSDSDIAACAKLSKQNEEEFKSFLSEIKDSELDYFITYFNSKGVEFKKSIRDILSQVILHGHYHRGQINSLFRAEGIEPVMIDYIIFAR